MDIGGKRVLGLSSGRWVICIKGCCVFYVWFSVVGYWYVGYEWLWIMYGILLKLCVSWCCICGVNGVGIIIVYLVFERSWIWLLFC